tara:strand:+ start:6214 stop:6849 length:636 start_codon:yes stop_codon:yes gene_type:complete
MEKLTFKTITTQEETELVLQKVESNLGVRLPDEYARNSKLVGVFLQGQLSACYMLVTRPNFRSLLFIPDHIKKSIELLQNDQFEMMEVNGLWIGPSLKNPVMQLRVWSHLILDIFMSKKRFVLLMQNSNNKCMERFMSMATPQHIYEGEPLVMAGEKTHKTIRVSFTTRWSIVLSAPKYLKELLQRQKRAHVFSQKQTYLRSLKHSKSEFA